MPLIRQPVHQFQVAELIEAARLAQDSTFLVRVGQELHQPPWDSALGSEPEAADDKEHASCVIEPEAKAYDYSGRYSYRESVGGHFLQCWMSPRGVN